MFRSPIPLERARSEHRSRRCRLEPLEERHLLAVTSTFLSGTLTINSNAADDIVVRSVDGYVKVNGVDPAGAVPASSVTSLIVYGSQSGNFIDLREVLPEHFTSMVTVRVQGSTSSATSAHDVIYGSPFNDTIDGGEGNDTIYGCDGDDQIDGGEGNDTIYGGRGNDIIDGGEGNDLIYGGEGNDTLNGNDGTDTLIGGDGTDTLINAGPGSDTDGDNGPSDCGCSQCGDDLLLAIDNITYVSEDEEFALVSVRLLNGISSSTITVNWSTQDLTALAGEDYEESSGQLEFAPGQDVKTIQIPLFNDGIFEPTEFFAVILSDAGGADIAQDTGVVEIADDEPVPTLSIEDVIVDEDSGLAEFVVTLSGPASEPVTVRWDTLDETAHHVGTSQGDYEQVIAGLLTFTPGGPLQQTISVTINQDAIPEADEFFYVVLSSPTVAVIDVPMAVGLILDDDPSTVSVGIQVFYIDENSPLGAVVGTMNVTANVAPDVGPLVFGLSGTHAHHFAIDSPSGVITVANPSALDFESVGGYLVSVSVAAAGAQGNSTLIAILINDVNEAPTLADATFDVDENSPNGTVVGTVVATDPDAVFDPAYDIVAGNDAGIFTIHPTTGVITVANSGLLNYEESASHTLTVRVRDGGTPELEDTAIVTIVVNDINEPPQLDDEAFYVAENSPAQSIVGTVSATYLDFGETITFAIIGGTGLGLFTIDEQTGVVRVDEGAQLDYESANTTYTLLVEGTDDGPGTLSDTAVITIHVTDVNEPPLVVNQSFSVDEGADYNTLIGTVVASDPDEPANALRFSIAAGNASQMFAIHPDTGALIVANGNLLDYETKQSHMLIVRVTDDGAGSLSAYALITINVQDVNEAPTTFDQSFTVNEDAGNGSTVGVVKAEDPDAGDEISFAIVGGNHNSAFAIDAETGTISVANHSALDAQLMPTFQLIVEISDLLGLTATSLVTVNVEPTANPVSITLTGIVRDFRASNYVGPGPGLPHPDFQLDLQNYVVIPGLVEEQLGPDGKPVLSAVHPTIQSVESFSKWFNDDPDYNLKTTIPLTLTETAPGSGVYEFRDETFWPIDNMLFGNSGADGSGNQHNFHFTMEVHATFTYRPEQILSIAEADDDLWIFIDNQLVTALDFGGIHQPASGTLYLDTLDLTPGATYSFDVFFAERRTSQSHLVFSTTIADLTPVPSTILLVENYRFLTTDESVTNDTLSFIVPTGGTGLAISFEELAFDLEDESAINDAFELALVDAHGQSLVPTIGIGRDAFFNYTEELGPLFAVGAGLVGGSVVVDVSHLPAGTEVRLIARLVNNDGVHDPTADDTTTVTIDPRVRFFDVTTLSAGVLSQSNPLQQPLRSGPQDFEFAALDRVTAGFATEYGRTSFNESSSILFADFALVSNGLFSVRGDTGPLLIGVANISDPSVLLHQPDGVTPDGIPYYDVSRRAFSGPTDRLELGERVEDLELRFLNPDRVQFSYEIVVLGALNRAPQFQSLPVTQVHVDAPYGYVYDSHAVDPDPDELVYSLLIGPDGMTIDAETGLVTWTTLPTEPRSVPVTIRATDPDGAYDDQVFIIDVIDDPNRPPWFTTIPVVDAFAGVEYVYPAAAIDPDGDSIAFSVDLGPEYPTLPPANFQIDESTGLVAWTPTVDQIGQSFEVLLRVTDEHGAAGTQSYTIVVHADPANRPPVIVSDPSRYFEMAGERGPAVGNVDPSIIVMTLEEGISDTRNVSITLSGAVGGSGGYADIVLIVDESGSMYGEHDWLADMIPDLEAALLAENIGAGSQPNRYGLVGFGGAGSHLPGHTHLVGGSEFGTATEVVAAFNTLQVSGAFEDGYHGIAHALTYSFREGAAVNFILVTDEDRDIYDPSLSYSSILADLQAAGALLNVVVSASYGVPPNPWSNRALGVIGQPSEGQTAYLAAPDGAYVTSEDPEHLYSFFTTVPDYVELAWELGGAAWDLNQLRQGGNVAQSFSNAFVEVKKNEILEQLHADVQLRVSGDAPVDILVDLIEEVPPGGLAQFEVTFTGDGRSRSFELEFVNARSNVLLGSIPVSINDDYHYDALAIDPDDDPITYSLLGQPGDATIDPVTGKITWVPPAAGAYAFVVRADDGRGGEDIQKFTVVVVSGAENATPVITSTPRLEATAGLAYYYQLEATDDDQDRLTYALVGESLPAGMSINSQNGLIEWIPASSDISTSPHEVTVVVKDGRGGEASQSFAINVLASEPANLAPRITSRPIELGVAGERYRYDLTAHDPDADKLTFDLVLRPLGMVIDADSGAVAWLPNESDAGQVHEIIVRVRDGRGGVDLQAFNVTVISLNEPPVITSEPVLPARVGSAFSYQVEASDPNGDSLLFALDPFSSALSMHIDATGLFTWVPTTPGNYRVSIFVSDGRGGIAVQEVVLPVVAVNENLPPDFISIPDGLVFLGEEYTYEIVAVDPDAGDSVTLSLDQASLDRGMAIDSSDVLRWNPALPGDYTVRVYADDNHGARRIQSFVVRVIDPSTINRPPEITSTPKGPAVADRLYQYRVTAVDPNGDEIIFSLDQASLDRGMTIDATTGLLIWTPGTGGAFRVEVTASDGEAWTTQYFTLPVIDNTPPIITSTPPTFTVNVTQQFTYPVFATDPNVGDVVTFSLSEPLTGMSIGESSGVFTWTPNALQLGIHRVSIVATDNAGASTMQSFDLLVIDPVVNNPPSIDATSRTTIQAGQTYLHRIQASDPDGDQLTYVLIDGPTGLSLDSAGLVTWQTSAADINDPATPHQYVVQVNDGRGGVSDPVSFTIHVTLAPTPNHAPEITSTPPGGAVVGKAYRYQAEAHDPDGDTLFWSLDAAPAGMYIHRDTGLLTWTPAAHQLGPQYVSVRVVDARGAGQVQSFTLTARGANLPPQIVSAPPTRAVTGQQYVYDVLISDPEGNAVTLMLTDAPAGMTVVPGTHRIIWTPTSAETVSVTLKASDGESDNTQTYEIVVSTLAANQPPVIVSTPDQYAVVGQPYTYVIVADDADGPSAVSFGLPEAAHSLMTLTGDTVQWTPSAAGDYYVTVTASDGVYIASQRYMLRVRAANNAPVISLPDGDRPHTLGLGFTFDARPYASDADNDQLAYRLSGPSGATIDERTGIIRWATDAITVGQQTFHVTVTDPYGASATDTLTVQVVLDTTEPTISVSSNATTAVLGGSLAFFVASQDDIGIFQQSLIVTDPSLNETYYPVGPSGQVNVSFTMPGAYTVQVTATDFAGNVGVSTPVSIHVTDPNNRSPQLHIASPTTNFIIREPVDIIGTVDDLEDDPVTYTLTLVPLGPNSGGAPVLLGTFAGERHGEALGAQIDPTLVPNGPYRLDLTATDGVSAPVTVSRVVQIETELKLGNFALAFTDLSIPFAGFNLAVVRSYDSLRAHVRGEFGYGWDLELENTELTVDIPPQAGYGFGRFKPFIDGTRVVVTLPDGSTEGFTFAPVPGQQFFGNVLDWRPAFIADYGVTSTLRPANPNVVLVNQHFSTNDGYLVADTLDSYNPADPRLGNGYILTTRTGVEYFINATTGDLYSITDRAGNTIYFTGNGVESASGIGINFERDWQGRITAVIDPEGNRIEYGYDAKGDLVSVTNRVQQTTQFVYDEPGRPHFLTGIVDPRGVEVLQVEFDPNTGRLLSLTDAAGQSAPFSYNLDLGDGRYLESVADADGVPTEFIRDARGNVLREIRHLRDSGGGLTRYLITVFQYDGRNNQTHASTPFTTTDPSRRLDFVPGDLVWATRSNYDTAGNVREVTDALGNKTRFDNYDTFGNPGVITDPLGNVTRNFYSPVTGNLTQTTDAAGNVTRFQYDSRGLLTHVIQGTGANSVTVSQSSYDAHGRLTSVTDAAGATRAFAYNTFGDLIQTSYVWQDPDSSATKLVTQATDYDLEGRVTGTRQYVDSVLLWSTITVYNNAGLVESEIDRFGRATHYIYDARGMLIESRAQAIDSLGASTWIVSRTVYDDNGRAVFTIDPHEDATPDDTPVAAPGNETVYDSLGRVVASRRFDSMTIELVDDPLQPNPVHRISALVGDPSASLLFESITAYDELGRVDHSRNADGLITRFDYDAAGRQIAVIHDTDGDLSTTADQVLASQSFYDAAGRLIRVVDALGHETRYEYDRVGRQVAVIAHEVFDPLTEQMVRPRTETVYDSMGRRVAVRENLWQVGVGQTATINSSAVRVTSYEYNNAGQLTAVVLPEVWDAVNEVFARPRYEYSYDQYGNQKSIVDPLQRETQFAYDELHRQISRILPNTLTEEFVYNELGQQTLHIDFEGRHAEFAYDALGRLEARRYFADIANYNGGNGTPVETVEYGYDALSRVLTVDDSTFATPTTQVYDAHGRLIQVDSPQGIINYAYDNVGQLTRTWTSKTTDGIDAVTDTEYGYDVLGRLGTVTVVERNDSQLQVPETTTYAYDLVGNLQKVLLPNGVVSAYEYDALNRLALLRHFHDSNEDGYFDGGDTLLAEFDYQVGIDGKRTRETETVIGSRFDWVYDSLGRLTRESYAVDGDSTNDFTADYLFDLASNRIRKEIDRGSTSIVDEVIEYFYDDNDRLLREELDVQGTTAGDHTTFYGYAGTQQARQTNYDGLHLAEPVSGETKTTAYDYDVRGRLAQVTVEIEGGSTTISSYRYGESGARVERTATVDSGAPVVTEYHIDPQNHTGYAKALEEIVDGEVERAYTIGHSIISQTLADDAVHHFVHDGHGSTRGLVDDDGLIVERYAFDAYGETLIGAGLTSAGAAQTTWLFAGDGQYDPASGLTNHIARWRDGARFLTLDPYAGNTQDPLSLHKYLYAHANPTQLVDPDGRSAISTGIKRLLNGVGVELGIRILIGIRATYVIGDDYVDQPQHLGHDIAVNRQVGRFGDGQIPVDEWQVAYNSRPDIVDRTLGTVYEVKSVEQAFLGAAQVNRYISELNHYWGRVDFRPGTWNPGGQAYTLADLPGMNFAQIPGMQALTFTARNVGGGVIVYETNIPIGVITAVATVSQYAHQAATLVAAVRQVRLESQVSIATMVSVIAGFAI